MISCYQLFAFLLVILPSLALAAGKTPSLLLIGNGYIYKNNMDKLLTMLFDDMQTNEEEYKGIYITDYEHAEAKFVRFVDQESSQLKKVINERKWDWVILQEQSEIPGMWDESEEFESSIESLKIIDGWIQKSGAETVLLMTWGRRTFDKYNPKLYPDFITMQERLEEGYKRYQQAISTVNRPVNIIPAGLAYKAMYEDSDSDFPRLYEDQDSAHLGYPSLAGSYLTACVIYATLTGNDVRRHTRDLEWLDPSFAIHLRQVADATVKDFNGDKNGPTNVPKKEYIPEDSSTKSKRSSSFMFLLFGLIIFGAFGYQKNYFSLDWVENIVQMIQGRLGYQPHYYARPVARHGVGQEMSYFSMQPDENALL